MKNYLYDFKETLGLDYKSLQAMFNVTRQSIYNYTIEKDFLELPLHVITRLIYYTNNKNIGQLKRYIEKLKHDKDLKVKEKIRIKQLCSDLQMLIDKEKSTGMKFHYTFMMSYLSQSKIVDELYKEYPKEFKAKTKKFMDHNLSSPKKKNKPKEDTSTLILQGDLSPSYVDLLEKLLNDTLEGGENYLLLQTLKEHLNKQKGGEK